MSCCKSPECCWPSSPVLYTPPAAHEGVCGGGGGGVGVSGYRENKSHLHAPLHTLKCCAPLSLSQRKRERRVFHFRPNVDGLKAIRYLFVFRTIVCQVHCLSSESWNLSPPPILPVKTTCKGGEGGKWCLTPSQQLRINMMAK